jgi:hypothetical protein
MRFFPFLSQQKLFGFLPRFGQVDGVYYTPNYAPPPFAKKRERYDKLMRELYPAESRAFLDSLKQASRYSESTGDTREMLDSVVLDYKEYFKARR